MADPEPLHPTDHRTKPLHGGTRLPLVLASLLALVVVVALSLLSFGFVAVMLLVVVLVLGVIPFHYLVWGWWLNRLVAETAAAEQEDHPEGQGIR